MSVLFVREIEVDFEFPCAAIPWMILWAASTQYALRHQSFVICRTGSCARHIGDP